MLLYFSSSQIYANRKHILILLFIVLLYYSKVNLHFKSFFKPQKLFSSQSFLIYIVSSSSSFLSSLPSLSNSSTQASAATAAAAAVSSINKQQASLIPHTLFMSVLSYQHSIESGAWECLRQQWQILSVEKKEKKQYFKSCRYLFSYRLHLYHPNDANCNDRNNSFFFLCQN